MNTPARMAAVRMPVPVAESQLKRKIASSGLVDLPAVGAGTTGGGRTTTLCRLTTGVFGEVTPAQARGCVSALPAGGLPLRTSFTCGTPQRKTRTLNNTHGTQARVISRLV